MLTPSQRNRLCLTKYKKKYLLHNTSFCQKKHQRKNKKVRGTYKSNSVMPVDWKITVNYYYLGSISQQINIKMNFPLYKDKKEMTEVKRYSFK